VGGGAEQLLNGWAAAIEVGNMPSTQHLLYVLVELASFSGEPNPDRPRMGCTPSRDASHAVRQAASL